MGWLSEYWLLLAILGGVVVFAYLLCPVLIYFRFRQAQDDFALAPSEDARLPIEVASYWQETARVLEPLGFQRAARFQSRGQGRWYLCIFEHRSRGSIAAAIVCICPVKGRPAVVTTTVAFEAEYQDHSEVSCRNCVDVSMAPRPPEHIILSFPQVKDLALLWHYQCEAERLYGPGRKRVLPANLEQWQADVDAQSAKLRDRMVSSGWWKPCADGSLRPTIVGAYVVTWRLMPPWTAIRRRMLGRREREVMRNVRTREGTTA